MALLLPGHARLEAPGLVADLDDVAAMGQLVERGSRHFRVTEVGAPSANVRLVVIITMVCS